MKFAIVGDIHLTDKQPKNRKDDYVSAQREKFISILEKAAEEDCQAVLSPGDLFDHHIAYDKLKAGWISLLRTHKEYPDIIAVPGQHDLRYHTSPINNTPMGVLEAAGVLTVIKDENPLVYPFKKVSCIYGAGWNKDIPKIKDEQLSGGVNILLTHRKVIKDKELWPGQEEFVRANYLLRSTKFDLIVTGDNHQSFRYVIGKGKQRRWLINCGSLMRKNIDQNNHKPCFWIYDTETKEAVQHLIQVAPFEKIFDLSTAKEEKEKNEKLEVFIKKLGESEGNDKIKGLDFKKNLITKLNKNKKIIHPETRSIIERMMEGINA